MGAATRHIPPSHTECHAARLYTRATRATFTSQWQPCLYCIFRYFGGIPRAPRQHPEHHNAKQPHTSSTQIEARHKVPNAEGHNERQGTQQPMTCSLTHRVRITRTPDNVLSRGHCSSTGGPVCSHAQSMFTDNREGRTSPTLRAPCKMHGHPNVPK